MDRFVYHATIEASGCWSLDTYHSADGYASFHHRDSRGRRSIDAHRFAYEAFVGPIPPGLTIDHLCRNRGCVNPSHLEVVTYRVNILRGDTNAARNLRKTHCPQGHAYDEANTIWSGRKRSCRECNRRRCGEYYRRRKELAK